MIQNTTQHTAVDLCLPNLSTAGVYAPVFSRSERSILVAHKFIVPIQGVNPLGAKRNKIARLLPIEFGGSLIQCNGVYVVHYGIYEVTRHKQFMDLSKLLVYDSAS